MNKWASDNAEGLHPYVRTHRWFDRESQSIVYAATLAEAKRDYGYTRELHTFIYLRRATVSDVADSVPTKEGEQP